VAKTELSNVTNSNHEKGISFATDALSGLTKQYLADNRPWIVAYSGGKDSTAVLQLTFNMLISLGGKADKPVFVLSSDTRLEVPFDFQNRLATDIALRYGEEFFYD
jgi:DNA sulfur modification protein DndC